MKRPDKVDWLVFIFVAALIAAIVVYFDMERNKQWCADADGYMLDYRRCAIPLSSGNFVIIDLENGQGGIHEMEELP